MINRGTIEIGSTLSSRRSSAIYQGFYAAAPQLDLNFVLQSCKAFESDANNREAGSEGDSGGASISRSLPNYYSQDRVRNAYAKGSFADCFRKPFGCPKCGRCFTVKGNMTRHLKYECGQAPRFQCPYCEFRSKQTSNVMSHIRTRHTGQRVYVVHLKYEN
ncbi:zinc finger protein 771-like isoform X2 [Hylaeus volcanicus]|uniref:zinc finger protein 771-like isoform X2 n=1 Tax=Hylaeus volcanicus TaxID=313075 RepID=UPI0023B7DA1C|nr:zinc finger protein 771-like isoform X2 [Hylaeus volcanicus]